MSIERLAEIVEGCLRATSVFDRDVAGASLFESDELRKENKQWLVVAAGINRALAHDVFPVHNQKAERATTPVRLLGGGEMSFLFLLRPADFPLGGVEALRQVVDFAPRRGIPLVEIREASWRISIDWDNDHRLENLLWEFDLARSRGTPMEARLRDWRDVLGFNPAHPPSHLHINGAAANDIDSRGRASHPMTDLRLAVGMPNPLALFLSLAAWIAKAR